MVAPFGTTSVAVLVVGTGSVPCETDENGTVGAIVVLGVGLELLSDGVVDGLVVGLGVSAGGRSARLRALGARELVGAVGTYAEERLLVLLTESEESTPATAAIATEVSKTLLVEELAEAEEEGRARSRAAVVANARSNRRRATLLKLRADARKGLRSTETSAKGCHFC